MMKTIVALYLPLFILFAISIPTEMKTGLIRATHTFPALAYMLVA